MPSPVPSKVSESGRVYVQSILITDKVFVHIHYEKALSSDRIKAEALRLGFSACGLAPAEAVDEIVATAFRQWLADGCHLFGKIKSKGKIMRSAGYPERRALK